MKCQKEVHISRASKPIVKSEGAQHCKLPCIHFFGCYLLGNIVRNSQWKFKLTKLRTLQFKSLDILHSLSLLKHTNLLRSHLLRSYLVDKFTSFISAFARRHSLLQALHIAVLKWWLWSGWCRRSSTSSAFFPQSTTSYGTTVNHAIQLLKFDT